MRFLSVARITEVNIGKHTLGPGLQMEASGVLRHRDELASQPISSMQHNKITRQRTGRPPVYGSTHCGVVLLAGIIQTQLGPWVQYSSPRLVCAGNWSAFCN